MSIAAAKAFRQQILKPADGVFLFHARAIERLIEEQLGTRLLGVSVPELPYYLMPRADFLLGLETENAEALSVIEGLSLPHLVILLPSPPQLRIEQRGLRRLQLDYWGRAYEAEVARAWQDARDDDRAFAQFGAQGLRELIGDHAFAEVRDVLDRDGVTLPIWDADLICRSFVAMVARLRVFAPGARGFFFPAIRAWAAIDDWLAASGLALSRPHRDDPLPRLLQRSRPGTAALPSERPLLPLGLPYANTDPDLPPAQPATWWPRSTTRRWTTKPSSPISVNPITIPIEQSCMAALRRGMRLHRHRPAPRRLATSVVAWTRRMVTRALLWTGFADAEPPGAQRRQLALTALEEQARRAQHGALTDRFAMALRALADARRLVLGLTRPLGEIPTAVEHLIAEQEAHCEAHMANLLAAKWKLGPLTADGLRELIARLAEDDRRPAGSPAAHTVLRHLEQLLAERGNDYYRLRLGYWLISPGRRRLRQILPFQSLLKSLRALDATRQHLEALPWPMADLERFSAILNKLGSRITDHLDTMVTPRLEQAMREADFVPHNHRETVAAQKMRLELLDVIKHRRHLKFTDARDIVARNILRLPDPTLDELLYGDRLARFDRVASHALPGIYRPGEPYIKGLQQLSAPLFGTEPGRAVLRHLLLPFGGAFLILKTLDLVIGLIPHGAELAHLTTPIAVLLGGLLANVALYTEIGRRIAILIWSGIHGLVRFVLYDGLRQLLHWGPLARLLKTRVMRGLWRSLIHPLLIGALPLIPIFAVAAFVDAVPLESGFWLAGYAFAIGTLARNTPAGRRFLDNLSTSIGLSLRRLNQALLIGLIQRLLYYFKEMLRRFAQWLHRVEEALTHHIGERPDSLIVKAILAPLWRLAEAFIQFYVTVLVEPQVNPIKHFPIVTIGHKLMLPFLPAITTALVDITGSILPKVIAYPFVTLTIAFLPGLFGFLVWELKENWRLYEANHRGGTRAKLAGGEAQLAIEPAIVGSHGETMTGLMIRGFHSGTLPKGFDRLRQVINDELRDQISYPNRLRRTQRRLEEVQYAMCVFFERELTFALREHCADPECALQYVETGRPRIATNLVELRADLYLGPGQARLDRHALPRVLARLDHLRLQVRISQQGAGIRVAAELRGTSVHMSQRCWALVEDDLRVFAGRVGVPQCQVDLTSP